MAMDSGSNKAMLLLGVVVVVGFAAVIGLRNLTTGTESTGKSKGQRTEQGTKDQDADSSDDSSSKQGKSSRVTSLGSQDKTAKETPKVTVVQREFTRTETTGSALQTSVTVAMAAGTSETEMTEERMENARKIADLVALFKNTTDPDERMDIADELGLIDDPESIKKLLELAATETDPDVIEALLDALSGLDAMEQVSAEAIAALEKIYNANTDPDVRISAQDALGEIANAQSADILRRIYADTNAIPSEKLNAAENLLRLRSEDESLLSLDEARAINEQLKLDFQAGTDPAFRSQAAMALALMGRENAQFFQESLAREQDPNVKNLLEKLSRMFVGQPGQPPRP
jgi:DNA-binding phage protein